MYVARSRLLPVTGRSAMAARVVPWGSRARPSHRPALRGLLRILRPALARPRQRPFRRPEVPQPDPRRIVAGGDRALAPPAAPGRLARVRRCTTRARDDE